MAGPGDLEVDCLNRVGDVEAVILLIPMAGATFDGLDARLRLGRPSLHS